MYYDYFGLKQPPFKITPDTSMFFPGGNRGAILDALIYTILNGEGIIKVVGEVGSGKTMLCRMLEKELPENVEVVYIANPSLSPENILHAIAFDLNLGVQATTSRLEVMNKLQEYLLQKHSSGQQVVVFIEEAQSMPVATLEEIRLLSNLETQQSKLLQILLFGQPELDEIISQREIRQLKERITYSFQLNPFTNNDIRDYLNSRLRACGYRSGEIFNGPAIKLIEHYSAGLVRRVNILADKALLAAYAVNTNCVEARHVRQAARDSEFLNSWWNRLRLPALWFALLLPLSAVLVWYFTSGPDPEAVQVVQVSQQAAAKPAADYALQPEPGRLVPAQVQVSGQPPPVTTKVITDAKAVPGEGPAPLLAGEHEIDPVAAGTPAVGAGTVPDEPQSLMENQGLDQASTVLPGAPVENAGQELSMMAGSEADPATAMHTDLLGLEGMYDPGEMGSQLYTDEELEIMRAQLERTPPEFFDQLKPSFEGDTCKLCWSIIYRPLIKSQN